MLRTVVAALSGTGVLLAVIAEVELRHETRAYVLTLYRRSVFDDDQLKVFLRLTTEALQQFPHLVGTVEHRDDDAVSNPAWYCHDAVLRFCFYENRRHLAVGCIEVVGLYLFISICDTLIPSRAEHSCRRGCQQ